MKKEKIFAANWKMYLTPQQAVELTKQASAALSSLANKHGSTIILCPSFSSLVLIQPIITPTPLLLGAQNCSPLAPGAQTGEESVATLKELDCSHCIIGHSERRANGYDTNESVAQKAKALLTSNITPIVCIGETLAEFQSHKTKDVLKSQLAPLFSLASLETGKQQLYIAYEPVWAIGTGLIPEKNYLTEIFEWLTTLCSPYFATLSYKLLYGGSVKSTNVNELVSINQIDGFLIGSSSLDFQEFEKIVDYCY